MEENKPRERRIASLIIEVCKNEWHIVEPLMQQSSSALVQTDGL